MRQTSPACARSYLEKLLGPATCIVASGGEWLNPETSEVEPKLHLHWRLNVPARGKDELAKLKQARSIACDIIGADPTTKPIVHPLRWPGSWHRKRTPKLVRIEDMDDDHEIDLDTALAALSKVAERNWSEEEERGNEGATPTEYGELIKEIISSESYHEPA